MTTETHVCKCSKIDYEQVIRDLAGKLVKQEIEMERLQEDKDKLLGEYNQIKSKEYRVCNYQCGE
jgi:uncharacterized coiled-coil protein SlyX